MTARPRDQLHDVELVRRVAADFREYMVRRSRFGGQIPSAGKQLIQRAAEAIAALCSTQLPVDVTSAARLLAVAIEFRSQQPHGSQLGKLVPTRGGFITSVYGQTRDLDGPPSVEVGGSPEVVLTTQGRFTLAHELAHCLFFSPTVDGEVPTRLIPAATDREGRWREEGLCHDFARALLLPSTATQFVARDASPAAIVAGARAFAVSKEVFLRRVLYDWNLWTDTSVLHVSLFQTPPRLQRLCGAHAPRARRGLLRVLSEEFDEPGRNWTPTDVAMTLQRRAGCTRGAMLVTSREVWALVARE